MHEGSAREGSREAFTGETTGWVSSCETGRIPRCRSSSLTRRQHPPRANGLRMEEPRAVGDPMHVETSFVRNVGGLIRVRQGMPERLMQAKGRTMSMHADEESDEVVLPVKRSNNEGLSSAETVEGRASPKGNGGQTAAARTLRRDTASNGLAPSGATEQDCTVHGTATSHHHRSPEAKLSRAHARCCARDRWSDVASLRRKTRRETERPARASASGQLPGPTGQTEVHPEGGRLQAAPQHSVS